jgi:YggT family protein
MDQLQTYVSALFTVFIIIIFIRILLSFVPAAPSGRATRAFWDFVHQSTEWFLGIFRRIIPPLGMFDLSPIVALLVLYIVRGLVLTLLDSI